MWPSKWFCFTSCFIFLFDVQHCLAQAPVQRGDGPLALVLAPTRELAQQIEEEVLDLSLSLLMLLLVFRSWFEIYFFILVIRC